MFYRTFIRKKYTYTIQTVNWSRGIVSYTILQVLYNRNPMNVYRDRKIEINEPIWTRTIENLTPEKTWSLWVLENCILLEDRRRKIKKRTLCIRKQKKLNSTNVEMTNAYFSAEWPMKNVREATFLRNQRTKLSNWPIIGIK